MSEWRERFEAEEKARHIEMFGGSYEERGVRRWASNDSVPPEDVLQHWLEAGLVDQALVDRSTAAREADLAAFLAEYRRRQPSEPSHEERMEARAAHGPGVELVDVFTGRRFTS